MKFITAKSLPDIPGIVLLETRLDDNLKRVEIISDGKIVLAFSAGEYGSNLIAAIPEPPKVIEQFFIRTNSGITAGPFESELIAQSAAFGFCSAGEFEVFSKQVEVSGE